MGRREESVPDVGALEDAAWMEIIKYVPITLGHEVAGVYRLFAEGKLTPPP